MDFCGIRSPYNIRDLGNSLEVTPEDVEADWQRFYIAKENIAEALTETIANCPQNFDFWGLLDDIAEVWDSFWDAISDDATDIIRSATDRFRLNENEMPTVSG